MADAVDTSLVWEIEQDQNKLNLLLLGALVFVAVGIWAITGNFSHTRRGAMMPYFGWASVVLFGAVGLFYIWQMVRPVAPIILSPEGIRIARTSLDFVPWTAVTAVVAQKVRGAEVVELSLDPDIARQLKLTPMAGVLNAGKSPRTLTLGAHTVKISHDELLRLVRAYVQAYSPGGQN